MPTAVEVGSTFMGAIVGEDVGGVVVEGLDVGIVGECELNLMVVMMLLCGMTCKLELDELDEVGLKKGDGVNSIETEEVDVVESCCEVVLVVL